REAFSILRESFKIDPQSSKTVVMIGIAQLAEGDTTRAIQAFQQALKLQPDNVTALASLGMIYSSKKRHWEALRLLEQAAKMEPNDQTYRKTYYDAWARYRTDSLNAMGWVTEKRSVTFR
ncbi:MAG: tetratricopeptide repeat protein, partial [Chlorobi bacterium]|nr:tetratricopeptide repeat protein [Chlorobiota bacterium]